ncbi:MAG TPA: hypothetical protein VG603_02305 [Chitinophagales bacterium]|nr:hypothetical protein [Chitinophagales bacterium]
MKTKILQYDLVLQSLLLFSLVIFPVLGFWSLWWLIMFFFVELLYQFVSGLTHLLLQHKSIGFVHYRQIHFWGGTFYATILLTLLFTGSLPVVPVGPFYFFIAAYMVVPALICVGYFVLCYYELNQLTRREFHILK